MAHQKWIVVVGIIAVIVAAFGMAVPQAQAHTYLGTVDITCADFTAAGTGADILDRDNTGVGQEKLQILVTDGVGTVLYTLTFQNGLGTYAGGMIGTTAYTAAPAYNPITVQVISLAGNGLPEEVDVIGVGECPGLPTFAVAGPDMVPIPSTAVVGSFVVTTPAYFEPRADAATDIVLTVGKTLWVFGVDASGEFYKVMISGRFFWVPVETMGPNFDEVWQGRPLPTDIVE